MDYNKNRDSDRFTGAAEMRQNAEIKTELLMDFQNPIRKRCLSSVYESDVYGW